MPVERICMSAMSEHRRASKPIMEKRRRARINNSLTELKSLILDATRKDCSRHSKLEKADILEMTVKHLQTMQRQQMAQAVSHDPTVLSKFKSGFTECAGEIQRYLNSIETVDKQVRARILAHLGTCLNGLHNYLTPLTFAQVAPLTQMGPLTQVAPPPPSGRPTQYPSPYYTGGPSPAVVLHHPHLMRSVPGNLVMNTQRQHFFPPSSGTPASMMSDLQSNCSSPSLSPFTPSSPLSPGGMSSCSKASEAESVWRPW
ncbi:putative Transcription factor HES-1 [Hypsibius exemplaris]|uniref:Transcription factor HES-1 n=1 Tax=Hypsibius exemplaris TaxID=2072580 RepID=A0A1W0X4U5_HYPEX|nr:putative Transcription factor HES-1 [Hypsibius exemplaris]